MGRNRLRLYFQSGVGPQNYYETLDNNDTVEPPSNMFALGTMSQNDLPLISVETSELLSLQCMSSCVVYCMHAHDVIICSLDHDNWYSEYVSQ